MLQALNERQVFVNVEKTLIPLQQRCKLVHITLLHTGDDLEVRGEWLHKFILRKDRSFRNFTHEQFNNDEQLLNLHAEAERADFRGLA